MQRGAFDFYISFLQRMGRIRVEYQHCYDTEMTYIVAVELISMGHTLIVKYGR